jgi:hypothetical protein
MLFLMGEILKQFQTKYFQIAALDLRQNLRTKGEVCYYFTILDCDISNMKDVRH